MTGRSGITWRALALSLLLIPLNTYILLHIEVIGHKAYPTEYAVFGNVVALVVVLMVLNGLLLRLTPRLALSPQELLVIYVALVSATTITNSETIFLLVGMLGHPTWFATPENHWNELFAQRLPEWLVVQDPDVVRGFYLGSRTFWEPDIVRAWATALAPWIIFLLALVVVLLCLSALLRKPWTESQRLSYPLTALPLQLTARDSHLIRHRLMWIGLGVTALVNLVNGLSVYYPSVPLIPRGTNLGPFLPQTHAWSFFPIGDWAGVPFWFSPFMFGLALLMPLDLVFSCWAFYVLSRLVAVFGAAHGWESKPGFPFELEQAAGAYLGILLYGIFRLRKHLMAALRKAVYDSGEVDDRGEPMAYRTAFIAGGVGLAFLLYFTVRAGMSPGLAVGFFACYFALSIVLARIRAESGVPDHDMTFGGPDMILVNTLGTRRMTRGDLSVLALFFSFTRAFGGHPMPNQVDGFRIGEKAGIRMSGLSVVMLVGTLAAAIAGPAIMLHTIYPLGAATAKVTEVAGMASGAWVPLQYRLQAPSEPNVAGIVARTIALAVTFGLYAIRDRGWWCPLHPIGYVMAGSWSMYKVWSSLFFSWLIKWAVLRYGGRPAYEQTLRLGFGMVLGDSLMGTFWATVGAWLRSPSYNPWP